MESRSLRKREHRRFMREQIKTLAWVFIASPILVLVFGGSRYSVWEAAVMPVVGILMLLWLRRHPTVPPHIAAVELVRPADHHRSDAELDRFYLAWCDCGWSGDDHRDEQSARAQARSHTKNVRPGLHAFGE
jgi:hypothetical protein